ncbi:putative 4-amino-4-deoxychorismate protein [Cercophora scortea]|uniref:4-amino-4-deoxychorismate protein n=1 Tax=Cercophora scortea TaxID=314031 RepID=A0AAE0MDV2_9PEZI|nr:putative 4-amino-4-deoxychorismate protein [Cercophora scortea]
MSLVVHHNRQTSCSTRTMELSPNSTTAGGSTHKTQESLSIFSTLRYDPQLLQVPSGSMDHAGWNHKTTSPFYMLNYHRDRMLNAAVYFGWERVVETLSGDEGLDLLATMLTRAIASTPGIDQTSPVRLRVSFAGNDPSMNIEAWGSFSETTLENLFPRSLPSPHSDPTGEGSCQMPVKDAPYQVVLAAEKISPSEWTHFKTSRRQMYDKARQRAQIKLGDSKEVLMVNDTNGTIMEGSTTTPYFWRHGRWVTPPVSSEYDPESGSGGQDGTTRRWALQSGIACEEAIPVDSVVDGEECWLSNGARGFMFGRIKL